MDAASSARKLEGPLVCRIHFWLGSQTSQDEAAVAAIKTVELDDLLGGSPIQHREVQGHESKCFLSYFRNGLRYLEGGIASGFNVVDDTFKPRLYKLKGKRIPVVSECAEIAWSQMNSGDVFILDAGVYVFLWVGSFANNMEKLQGAKVAQKLKNEHGLACEAVVIIEDGKEKEDLVGAEEDYFDGLLPISEKGNIGALESDETDEEAEQKQRARVILYKCSDASGELSVEEVKHGPLDQEDLSSDVC